MKKLLLLIILLFGVSITILADCRDLNTFDLFDSIKVNPPAKILEFTPERVKFKIETKERIKIGEFLILSDASLPKDFPKNYKNGLYWIITCKIKDDERVLFIQSFEAGEKFLESQ